MNRAELVSKTYHELVGTLNAKLSSQQYAIIIDKNEDKVFGSHYTIWSNNADALRLLWDGKEELFILTVTDNLPLSHLSAWNEIVVVPFGNTAWNDRDTVINSIMTALN